MRSLITSMTLSIFLVSGLLTDVHSTGKSVVQQYLTERAGELIKVMAAHLIESSELSLGGEQIYAPEMLERFYKRRNYQPAWIGSDGSFPHAEAMLDAIEEVRSEGLTPDYYHLEPVRMLIAQLRKDDVVNPEVMAELDVLLTDSFLMLGCRFSAGCVDPVTIESAWFVNRSDLAVDIILDDALKEDNIKGSLRELLPLQAGYSSLRQRLIQLTDIVSGGGWPMLSENLILKKGNEGRTVSVVKKRLIVSNDLDYSDRGEENRYDDELEQAVIRFQKRHGINPDGIVGPETVKAMNIPAEQRLRQIEVNLERMRWTSRNLGHRYIIVNIAAFKLELVEHEQVTMAMEVVVGKPFWDTPVFSRKMKYIILNPSWNIPESIAIEEILPKIRRSQEYLTQRNIKIFGSWADDAEEIAPSSIEWEKVGNEKFPYIFRQAPGPLNPLGRIKFMLPNKFHIYLHDTPAKGLFSRNSRAFSHGCIRVQRPVDLAEYLLENDPEWSREKIITAFDEGQEIRIDLALPVNVHIVYLTAWVDEEDVLNFRNDVYGRDEKLDKALRKKAVTISASISN